MQPSEGAAAVEIEARTYAYDTGAAGPARARPVAVEAPVQFVIGGAAHAVMMATPQDLEDFAYGFLLTEGIAASRDDIRSIEVEPAQEGWRIAVALTGDRLKAHMARKRVLAGRTGCGLCGVEDFADIPAPRVVGPGAALSPAAVGAALTALESRQPLNALTRAVHGAAWVAHDGRIVLVREDVGRHNALDKAIGALWRESADPRGGFFLITSRCSFEMVVKTALFGASALVSVSAPTSLALEKAQAFGVTLLAVARRDSALSFGPGGGEASGGMAA
jgi:FdhD protein